MKALKKENIAKCDECSKMCEDDQRFKCKCCLKVVHLKCLPKKTDSNALQIRGNVISVWLTQIGFY